MLESCIHNEDNSAECNDQRLDEDRQDYTRLDLENYICTNPDDYNQGVNYALDLRKKLITCEAELKKSKRR